jgi:dipeptidyl aminopeptidase/acylaminoacyl peptidase
VQPEWGRHATLYVCSDRSNWWNVYRVDGVDRLAPVVSVDAEVSLPGWSLGQRRFLVRADGSVVAVHEDGTDAVLTSVAEDGQTQTWQLGAGSVAMLADDGEALVGIVQRLDRPVEICRLPDADVLRAGSGAVLPPEAVSVPTRVTFPTGDGEHAFAWFSPPVNPAADGPEGERPPLLVLVHGGPTSAASPWFSPKVQFWTSRGFAVAAVDYRGSTGYGRRFRELLHGQWCVADVEDVCAAATYLAEAGLVDPTRGAIRGGSAGGTTALLATLGHDAFAAAVAMYAVTDLEALVATTHKFESRYFDTVLGPLPEAADLLRDRSPLSHVENARVPTLVLQGLDDAVVPPAQAELLTSAFAQRGVPYAYLTFEGEQHGFRSAEAQVRALEAELDFLGQVFGFVPADEVPHLSLHRSDG